MKFGIMGSGGTGAYTGARLQAAGHDVAFIARRDNLAAMQSTGLTVLSPAGDTILPVVRATDDPRTVGPVDIVLFSVKLWDTVPAAILMRPMVGPDTLVVTVQNGIDSADMIGERIARNQVARGAYYISAHLEQPGLVRHAGGLHRITVESLGGDERLQRFAEACNATPGLDCELVDDGDALLWSKFILLSAFSGATALMRAPLGAIRDNPEAEPFLRQLIDEAQAVAVATGRPGLGTLGEDARARLYKHAANARASMAEDLLHNRRLELRWLSGRVHSLGLELGVPTPAHTAVFRALVLYEHGVLMLAPDQLRELKGA